MQKVLICASTLSHINNFHLPYLKFFKEQGFEVHVAAPGSELPRYADFLYDINITKSLLSSGNLRAVRELKSLFSTVSFDAVLFHTTLAAFVGRCGLLLAKNKGGMVINTVHGYLFWNGCGLLKRLAYYLPELALRNITDCVIAMNAEDYLTAQRLVRPGGLVVRVPGMGVESERFSPTEPEEKSLARQEMAIPDDAFVLIYAAELSERKNHIELIRAMERISASAPKALLLLCGDGKKRDEVAAEVERLGLTGKVRFLGWQRNMAEIYKACDMAVSSSRSEGLPFNIVEAQLCALPVAASDIRGHRDLIASGENGWLYPSGDAVALAKTVIGIINSDDKGKRQGNKALSTAAAFTLEKAFPANTAVYKKVFNI